MTDAGAVDVVVVGAGPAGCVLASRLTEDSDQTVLLLEAGPDYGPDPAGWPADLRAPTWVWPDSHPWGYLHSARPAARPLPLARAKVVGGSSTINACFWLRGSAADYDAWAAAGNPGWGFADLLPFFRRSEADPLGGPLHGTDGPVPVSRVGEGTLNPVHRAFAETAEALGFPWVADVNGDPVQRPGIGPMPKNIAAGVRMNAAFTYLTVARTRPNLAVMADTTVDRILVANGRVAGVRTTDGRTFRGREIVLCAGAFGSPAILLGSGVGPATHLRNLGIPLVADVPGVGQHLLDHPFLPSSDTGALWPLRPEAAPATHAFVPLLVKACSQGATDEIDLHLYASQRFDADCGAWVWGMSVSLMNARSRGSVRLASSDPTAPPVIDHAYFSDEGDLDALGDGFALALRMVASDPLVGMLVPGGGFAPTWQDRDGLRAWVRENASTTWHPQSTCRMGPASDPGAVVDHQGRVRGVTGLRVADASVFPGMLRANLHCTVVAVAEKLADTVRSREG